MKKTLLGLLAGSVGISVLVFYGLILSLPSHSTITIQPGQSRFIRNLAIEKRPAVFGSRLKASGKLWLTLHKKDPRIPNKWRSYFYGPYQNLIVNAGEAFLVDAWQNITEIENMKYHGIGTTNTAAAEGDTALAAELTTVYNPDNTRATGSTTEASASVFRTVGTNTVDGSAAVVEWGLFSQAATGGGTLWSRVVFSTINLANGDSLQTTYDLTVE